VIFQCTSFSFGKSCASQKSCAQFCRWSVDTIPSQADTEKALLQAPHPAGGEHRPDQRRVRLLAARQRLLERDHSRELLAIEIGIGGATSASSTLTPKSFILANPDNRPIPLRSSRGVKSMR
jgi:hypothetical protein